MTGIEDTAGAAGWERETAALRALARSLVADEHAAEDAVQDTWLRALERGAAAAAPRRWMARVLRNRAHDEHRARGRRAAREQQAARDEALPSSDEIVTRLELVQRLAREVAALPEPYRTALHLRHFEGCTPDEIARRLGVPLETARTRLRRGLALLRERMDAACGGRRDAWVLALVPLARGARAPAPAPPSPLPWIGGLLVGTKLPLAAAAGLVAVVVATSLALREPPPVAAPPTPPAVRAAPDLRPAAPEPARAAADDARLAVEPPPVDPAPAAVEPSGDALAVDGRVVVVDREGREHRGESGRLSFAVLLPSEQQEQREVELVGGRFALEVPRGTWIAARRLEAGGRDALLEPGPSGNSSRPDPVQVVEPLALELRARWVDEVLLRVVDAADGRELSDVEVRRRTHWRAIAPAVHPGDAPEVETVAAGAASPVALPDPGPGLRVVPHWVRAPGYAWRRVDVDCDAGGERTVRLAAGGALEVRALGARPDGELYLRLFAPGREDGASFAAVADVRLDAQGAARIADLEPGAYVARIDRGAYDATLTLASQPVAVTAGQTAALDLALDAGLLDGPRTALSGTLTVPDGMELERVQLRLAVEPRDAVGGQETVRLPLAGMRPSADDPLRLEWDAGLVRRAQYLASVSDVMHRERIDATAGARTEAHLVVPPLARVTAAVVDSATDEPLARARVQWADGELEGVSHNSWAKVRRESGAGVHVFRAPLGELQISAEAEGYVGETRAVQLEGDVELDFRLERASGVRIAFYEGEARVPIALEVQGLRVLDAATGEDAPEGTVRDMRTTSKERLVILRPGAWTLELLRYPEGYRRSGPIGVEVLPGQITDVRVAVERAD